MALTVEEVEAILRLKDEMTPQLRRSVASLEGVGATLRQVGESMRGVGTVLTAAVTVPMVAATAASVKFSADFQNVMTRVGSLTAVGTEGVGEMRQAILQMAPAVGVGPRALGEALLVVASTGLKGATALSVLEQSAKASAIGLGDAKDVARAVTSAMTAYGVENLSAEAATRKLFVAVREGGAEAHEFAGTLGRVVGIASQVGVSFDEVLASVASFTRLGVDAAEATTALRGVMSTVLKPSKDATEQLIAMGTSIEALRANIREKGLAQALVDLVALTKGNDDAIAAIVPNVRALAGVMGTAGAQADAYRQGLSAIKGAATEFDDAFKTMSETVGFKWNVALAQAQTILITFGDAIGPVLVKALQAMQPLVEQVARLGKAFADMPPGVQTAVVALGALAAAAGPLLLGAGSLVSLAGHAATLAARLGLGAGGLGQMASVAATQVTAVGTAAKASGLLMGGLTAALAGIVVPVALSLLVREFQKLREHQELVASAQRDMATASDIAGRSITSLAEAKRVLNAEELRLQEVQKRGFDAMQGGVVAFNQYVTAGNNVTVTADKTTGALTVLAQAATKSAAAVGAAAVIVTEEARKWNQEIQEDSFEAIRQQAEWTAQWRREWAEREKALQVAALNITTGLRWMATETRLANNELRGLTAEGVIPLADSVQRLGLEYGPMSVAVTDAMQAHQTMTAWMMRENEEAQRLNHGIRSIGQSFMDTARSIWDGMTGNRGLTGLFENLGTGIIKGFGDILSGGVTSLMNQALDVAWHGLKKLGGWFKDLFGGPSAQELGGREVAREFERTVNDMFRLVQDRVEPAHQQWQRNNILLREAYIALGHEAPEAIRLTSDMLTRLHEAEKRGGDATRQVMQEIVEVLKALERTAADSSGSMVNGLQVVRTAVGAVIPVADALNRTLMQPITKDVIISIATRGGVQFDQIGTDAKARREVAEAAGWSDAEARRQIESFLRENDKDVHRITSALGIPAERAKQLGFQYGGEVRETGFAFVHAGERVEPAAERGAERSQWAAVLAELRVLNQMLRTMPKQVASAAVLAQR